MISDRAEIPQHKIAPTQHPVCDLLRQRWSPLAFSERKVESEKLRSLLEAASWAASCFNEQPWCYIIATSDNAAEFQRLLDCIVPANQEWAKNAPVLMISVAKLNFDRNGTANRHAFHDVGAASANLAIQATALGLYIHQMGGFDVDKTRETYGIPEGYEPVAAIALGYLGDSQTLSETLQQRENAERSRKPLETFVFSGNWGQSPPLVQS